MSRRRLLGAGRRRGAAPATG